MRVIMPKFKSIAALVLKILVFYNEKFRKHTKRSLFSDPVT